MLTIENPGKFDWKNISLADCIEGNCYDTYFTLKLYEKFKGILEGEDRWKLLTQLISPMSDTFVEMEYKGVDISRDNLAKVGKLVGDDNADKEDELYRMDQVSFDLSLTSPADKAKILFMGEKNREAINLLLEGKKAEMVDEKGFGLYPPEYTKEDAPTTKKEALETVLTLIEDELNKREDA